MKSHLSNRHEIEKYVRDKLHVIYGDYPKPINLDTTFNQLESRVDTDLVGAHLFLDIEDDFGIEMTEDEALTLNAGNVRDVVDYITIKMSKSANRF